MDKQLMKKRINEVIKTDATVVELQDFMATHVPFKKLKYYTSGIDSINGKELKEEEFFYEFIDNTRDKHNFIVVQGDNGSGKSHFIRWIKNKINSENLFPDDVMILLERSQNTLQATIKQLLNNEIIQDFLSEEEKIKLRNTGIELSEEKFSSMINYNFIIEAENEEDDDEDCVLRSTQRKALVEFLKDEVIQRRILFNEDGPIKRISNKLISSEDNSINEVDIRFTEDDFVIDIDVLMELKDSEPNKKALKFAESLKDDKRGIRNKVAEYLNLKIDTVIQRTIKLNATDLNSILEKIRIRLKDIGKDLILFIEDITAFTGIDKGVIESLIIEHREENGLCRLFSIIGVTTGYYQSYFPDNLKDRVTGRVFIDSNSLFDESKDVLELAARYINAINVNKDELRKWIETGAVEAELPIKNNIKEWAKYIDIMGREFSLYPLTEQAILNLYDKIKDKNTPRRFIKNVLLPILLHFTNDNKFPEGVLEFEAELALPKFKNELLNRRIDLEINDNYENSRTKCFLRIWGNGTIDSYSNNGIKYIGGIDERIFEEFNVIKIEGNTISPIDVDKPSGIDKVTNDWERSWKSENINKNREDKEKNVINEKDEILSQKFKSFNDLKSDLDLWFKENQNLKIHSKIRTEIVSLIKEGINWDSEEVPLYLVKEAITLNNIKIRDQKFGEERGSNLIWIEKTEENYYFMISLMQYCIIGGRTWGYEGAQDDIVVITKWLEKNKKRIISYILNGDDVDYSMYDYAICAEIYTSVINKTFKDKHKEVKLTEMSMRNIYELLISELNIKDTKDLKKILGNFATTYSDKVEDIKENHRFIIENNNCPLGSGKSIFLDTSEILLAIKRVAKKQYDLDKFETIKFKKSKELWKRPYDLLKKLYGENLESAVLEVRNSILINDKEYLSSFDDIGIINNFFSILDINNIHYLGEVRNEFNNMFDDFVLYNKYTENRNSIKEFNTLTIIDKIYLLKSNVPKEVIAYNDVLEKVENLIRKQEVEYSNKECNNTVTSEEIKKIKENCILEVENMENNIHGIEETLRC